MFFFNFDFFGRDFELKQLHSMYEKEGFSFACIYGRRRVGKSSLIKKFISETGCQTISFTAIEHNDAANLQEFSDIILNTFPNAKNYLSSFENWGKAFDYIVKESNNNKLVIFIDEFPYIAQSNPSISSILQKLIDEVFVNTNIKLIICGSSMSFMENQVLGYKSPLYGRRTMQMQVKPFDYSDTAKMVYEYTLEDKVLMYAVTGGIPYYINMLKQNHNLEEGIINCFLNPSGSLYEEPNNLLKQELREPALYNSIISSIALGNTRLNNISSQVHEENKKVSKYLHSLMDLHIIGKENPILNEAARKGIYRIKDYMYQFWYRYVPANVTNIENGMGKQVFENSIKPNISVYLGNVFEDICKQYMMLCNKKGSLPFMFEQIGRWWGGNPTTKEEEEIDLIAYNSDNIIFGECKYKNEILGKSCLNDLIRKSQLLPPKKNVYFYFI
jgi:AAA+ ATPase superfamily predicted ATPase